jgi:hypothetical protein
MKIDANENKRNHSNSNYLRKQLVQSQGFTQYVIRKVNRVVVVIFESLLVRFITAYAISAYHH